MDSELFENIEYWWTDGYIYNTGGKPINQFVIRPFWQRFLFCPFYALYTIYLCLRGSPIKVLHGKKKVDG